MPLKERECLEEGVSRRGCLAGECLEERALKRKKVPWRGRECLEKDVLLVNAFDADVLTVGDVNVWHGFVYS